LQSARTCFRRKSSLTDILIIPDAHADPRFDNERFDLLGRYIADRRPDKIVCLGDFADMPSLSSYDKGKKSFEGRRYKDDVFSTIDAQQRLFLPTNEYNYRRSRTQLYKPAKYMILGNHDSDRGRIGKALSLQPELDGVISAKDLRYQDFWDSVTDFKDTLVVEGIAFSHFFASGVNGNPIGGENIASSMLKKLMQSAVSGHTHVLDHAIRTRADGTRAFGLCAGCYVHPDYKEGWNANTVDKWWNGVIMLGGVSNGMYETYEEIPQSYLKKVYGHTTD